MSVGPRRTLQKVDKAYMVVLEITTLALVFYDLLYVVILVCVIKKLSG